MYEHDFSLQTFTSLMIVLHTAHDKTLNVCITSVRNKISKEVNATPSHDQVTIKSLLLPTKNAVGFLVSNIL